MKGELEGVNEEISKSDIFAEKMQLAQEFAHAAGDIANSIFDANISKIDEEIAAEEEKYARLSELHEGDAEQQKNIAIQREKSIKELEKERRKEHTYLKKGNVVIEIISEHPSLREEVAQRLSK